MRKIHTFAVGLPQSGIEEVWHLFKEYMSVIDAYSYDMMDAIMDQDDDRIDRLLIRKDKLDLDVDTSSLNGYVIKNIVRLFPDAKIILTVRDCFGWSTHFLQHCYANRKDEAWMLFWDWLFSTGDMEYPKEEISLKERGLYPLCSYTKHWGDYTQMVLDVVPSDRLFILRSLEVNFKIKEIAEFVGVPPNTLHKVFTKYGLPVCSFLPGMDFTYFTAHMPIPFKGI